MALDGEILYFMSVQDNQTSFEERRIQDYLSAFRSTGRPPQPCPQSPDTPNARAVLGLPPLFVPTAVPVPADAVPTDTQTTRLTDLPAHHAFRPTKPKINVDAFESISAQSPYTFFSFEELRCHAYAAGHKIPPPVVPTTAMAMTVTMASEPLADTPGPTVHAFYTRDSRATAYNTVPVTSGGNTTPDYLMAIVASPKFEKHSFEELRIAYSMAGKEVGSSEIPTRGALPAQSAPSLFGRPRGDAFSTRSVAFP